MSELLMPLEDTDIEEDLKRILVRSGADVLDRIATELRTTDNPRRVVHLAETFVSGLLSSMNELDDNPLRKNVMNYGGLAGGQNSPESLMAQFTPFFEKLTGDARAKKIKAQLDAIATAKRMKESDVEASLRAELAEMLKEDEAEKEL